MDVFSLMFSLTHLYLPFQTYRSYRIQINHLLTSRATLEMQLIKTCKVCYSHNFPIGHSKSELGEFSRFLQIAFCKCASNRERISRVSLQYVFFLKRSCNSATVGPLRECPDPSSVTLSLSPCLIISTYYVSPVNSPISQFGEYLTVRT